MNSWVDVNLCNGARCPCLAHPSAICQCQDTVAVDQATLSTRVAVAIPSTFGGGLRLNFQAGPGAVHHTSVLLLCDPQEYGMRLLFGDGGGDGHGGIAYGFASKAGCGQRVQPQK
jgi:hypothetical protein